MANTGDRSEFEANETAAQGRGHREPVYTAHLETHSQYRLFHLYRTVLTRRSPKCPQEERQDRPQASQAHSRAEYGLTDWGACSSWSSTYRRYSTAVPTSFPRTRES